MGGHPGEMKPEARLKRSRDTCRLGQLWGRLQVRLGGKSPRQMELQAQSVGA